MVGSAPRNKGDEMKDDLISRQAAIEIVERYDKSHMALKQRPMLGAAPIVMELEELPSAQPEYTEQDMMEQFNAGYACGMHAAQPESKREWYMKGYRDAQANIVQCEDCKWRRNQNGTMAWIPCRALVTPDDFYCKYAERKEQ